MNERVVQMFDIAVAVVVGLLFGGSLLAIGAVAVTLYVQLVLRERRGEGAPDA